MRHMQDGKVPPRDSYRLAEKLPVLELGSADVVR